MAAQTFDVMAVVLPNPQIDDSPNAQIINASLGYSLDASNVIRTLSGKNPDHLDAIEGLLYVPNVNGSACGANELASIPSNVTTLASFAPESYAFIALAPWTSPSCVQAYLASMRSTSVVGAIFYHGNNDTGLPPPVSDSSWSLNDSGRWQSQNHFPVYAIPGAVGVNLMTALAVYSGNMSSAPWGNQLVNIYEPSGFVRLYARMGVTGDSVPPLWVFLIVVLGAVVIAILVASVFMHLVQRRQRDSLLRRIANGEVDLEVLGIKRLTVPQELLDDMPCYAYTAKSGADMPGDGPSEQPFNQPTCSICLDDFVPAETMVRELRCRHIFHPECIDKFLRESSSLCPLCKTSALPLGYCPVKITNRMVRRERLMRRDQARAASRNRIPRRSIAMAAVQRRLQSLRLPSAFRSTTPATPNEQPNNSMELVELTSNASMTTHNNQVPPEVHTQGTSARRAWFRERMARLHEQEYAEAAEEARIIDEARPLWRRFAGRLNPRWE